jgi:uncharacterized protein YecA (UPF0149 family)
MPTARTEKNTHIYENAARMTQTTRAVNPNQPKNVIAPRKTKKPGWNDPCPCGSGAKYKRCHGR